MFSIRLVLHQRGLRAALFRALLASIGLVILGSLNHGTTRLYNAGAPDETLQADGAHRWAGWVFVCGVLAFAAVWWWVRLPRRRVWLAAVVVLSCAVAFREAGSYWLHVLDERERERDYALRIAAGLPIATVSSAIGAILAMVLALILLLEWRRSGSRAPAAS